LTFDSFNAGSGLVYRALKEHVPPLGWAQAPCALCPSFEFCKPEGPVNPQECVYYDDWLASKSMATEAAMAVDA
jgi:DNA-directed RNA polymerase III subunit RPC6